MREPLPLFAVTWIAWTHTCICALSLAMVARHPAALYSLDLWISTEWSWDMTITLDGSEITQAHFGWL